jgi:predicted DNA-binding transcriptional regulator YafY
MEYLTAILDAILRKKVLRIEHKRFDADEIHIHTVHPFFLKEYRNRWYLVGYQSDNQRIQTYGIERIKSLVILEEEAFTDIAFDPEEYYRHAIGVIVYEQPPVDIVLRFTAKQGMYVLTQPVHESQEIVEQTNDHITIRLHLVPAYELLSMILGWGADVEVMEPLWLRDEIAAKLTEAAQRYNSLTH